MKIQMEMLFGSVLAIYNALIQLGKKIVDVIVPEYPAIYKFLPGSVVILKD